LSQHCTRWLDGRRPGGTLPVCVLSDLVEASEERRTGSAGDGYRAHVRTVLLGDRPVEVEEWLQTRRKRGVDLFDEMWEGEYHVAPAAHSSHGDLDQQLAEVLGPSARAAGLRCLGPVNIGEPSNYRVPDRCVVATDGGNHVFLPTAIVVVEIASPDDETYAKFGFYFARAVMEVLVVDLADRSVRWFSRSADRFVPSGGSGVLNALDDLAAGLHWPR